MTKAEIVSNISEQLGIDKGDVQATVVIFMEEVKTSLEGNENVNLRGVGSCVVNIIAEKTGRNMSKNTVVKITAHTIPAIKPAILFVDVVKTKVPVQ